MRPWLSLYVKILLWFFLNLVVLAAVFTLLFNAQFSLNLDWLLASGARERIEAVRDLIVGELNVTSPAEWPQVVERYSEAHRVRFALLDEDANLLVGDAAALPREVQERIMRRDFGPRPTGDARAAQNAPTDARPFEGPWRSRRRPPLRAIMRTTNPTQYWLLTSARVDNWLAGDPLRVVLVARSSSMSGGGLIFNPKPWLASGIGAVIFSLLFWFPLVHGITRSVGKMRAATREIAEGRFDVRLKMRRRDELGSLGESIDQMADRLDGFLKGQKRFLGDIAHELCSPLARLQLALGILYQRASPEQTAYVRAATEKAEQIASLVGELLSFSKASFGASAIRLQPVALRKAVDEALRRESTDGAEFRIDVPADLTAAADPDLLIRALANLFRNAVRYAGTAGPIEVRASQQGDEVSLTVADHGPGVADEELPRIFDAFYRVDTARTRDTGGAGLGLALVKTCLESCCGSVTARGRQPHGLEVVLQLRAMPPAAADEVGAQETATA
jgi:two-component system sensor histidine kinase CpxA